MKLLLTEEEACFGNIIELAETFGWKDHHPDSSDSSYCAEVADAIYEDALWYIQNEGWKIQIEITEEIRT